MSLQFVKEAGKCVANGATVTGVLGKKISVTLNVAAKEICKLWFPF
jgi:hypothetical protein